MSFAKRKIDVSFKLGTGSFGETTPENDTVTVTGLRVLATIQKYGAPALNKCFLRIFGMRKSEMNKLSGINAIYPAQRNDSVVVNVGDDETGMSLAFGGILYYGCEDLQGAPEVSFVAQSMTSLFNKLKPAPVRSYPGSADVATIMSGLATAMGYQLVNCGVSAKISNPYLHGTLMQQVEKVAEIANIFYQVEDERYLIIVPKNGVRTAVTAGVIPEPDSIPLISKDTGMVGYPKAVAPAHLMIRTLYNPSILFMGKVNVQSSIERMSGIWRVRSLTHTLESEAPNGAWFTDIEATAYPLLG